MRLAAGSTRPRVAAAQQSPGQLDVFFVDEQGRVNVTWVIYEGAWSEPVPITAENAASPGADIVAAQQSPAQLDVFYADQQGRINVMWVVDEGAWNGPVTLV